MSSPPPPEKVKVPQQRDVLPPPSQSASEEHQRLTEPDCEPRGSGGDQRSLVNTTAGIHLQLDAPVAPRVLVLGRRTATPSGERATSRRTATPSGGTGDQQANSDTQRRDGRPAAAAAAAEFRRSDKNEHFLQGEEFFTS